MKKVLLTTILLICTVSFSQTRGVKIGYIDMEYILEKVPEYAESKNQLNQRTQKWKQEIEIQKNEIQKIKDDLKSEKALLTKELIEEREEEIAFQEKELLDYQEKRFGPKGDLIIQKTTLIKPIQDQVFTAIQDIAEQQKYDFIFDKSSELTILFAAQRHDISDRVIRALTRTQKREQLNKKQLKEQEAQEAKEDMQDENPALAERQKLLDEKKAAREKLIEEKKIAREKLIEDRKKAAEEKRAKIIAEREAKKNGTVIETDKKNIQSENKTLTPAEKRAKIIEERKKLLENKKQEAVEKQEE